MNHVAGGFLSVILKPRSVLLVDDHPLFREGLKKVVSSHSRLEVLAEATDMQGALLWLAEVPFDLMITDLRLAQDCGHELIQRAREIRPELIILVVSVNNQNEDVLRAIEAGAAAYLTKGASRAELLLALDEVLEGRSFLHSEVAHAVFDKVRRARGPEESSGEVTHREQEVLELLVQGKSNREISEQLKLSILTVKTHIRNLYRKQGVSSRTELLLKQLESLQKNRR